MSVREQERRRIILQMKADKYPQSEIDRALRMRDMMDDYAVSGSGWDELAAEGLKVEKEYWMTEFIGGLPARDAPRGIGFQLLGAEDGRRPARTAA